MGHQTLKNMLQKQKRVNMGKKDAKAPLARALFTLNFLNIWDGKYTHSKTSHIINFHNPLP
jgi:hypothetical protein